MFFTSGFSSFMRESFLFYISLKTGVHSMNISHETASDNYQAVS